MVRLQGKLHSDTNAEPGIASRKQADQGAALVEFALVLPVLIIFFIGITELGRAFTARAAIDTSSYWAARSGAGAAATVRSDVMGATFAKLNSINPASSAITYISFASDLTSPGIIRATVNSTMRKITNSTALDLHSAYTSVDLTPPITDSDYSNFGNSGAFDCDGKPVGSLIPGNPGCPPPNDGGQTGGSTTTPGVSCGGQPCFVGGSGGPLDGQSCAPGPILMNCNF